MTFAELQDAVLEVFSEEHRPQAQRWINLRLGQLWTLERWTFRYATDDVAVTAGSTAVSALPADLGRVLGLWDSDGCELHYRRPKEWERTFRPDVLASVSGRPAWFTVLAGTIKVGPAASADATDWHLLYLRALTDLVNDADVPGFPDEFHWLLVHGAQATGQAVTQDPAAALNEQLWVMGLDQLRRDYLEDAENIGEQWAADWDWSLS